MVFTLYNRFDHFDPCYPLQPLRISRQSMWSGAIRGFSYNHDCMITNLREMHQAWISWLCNLEKGILSCMYKNWKRPLCMITANMQVLFQGSKKLLVCSDESDTCKHVWFSGVVDLWWWVILSNTIYHRNFSPFSLSLFSIPMQTHVHASTAHMCFSYLLYCSNNNSN